jgi:intein-encoded DNA endonuclease-like protein
MKQIEIEKIIKQFIIDKLSCTKIAKGYDCDPETIRLILKKNGIDTNYI